MAKPTPGDYPVYFQRYIDQVREDDLMTAFHDQAPKIGNFLSSLNEERSSYAYAEGKWTLRELLQHVIDTERIFNYRALCIARNEKVSLPGFDEDQYAAYSNANSRTWQRLAEELLVVRQGTESLFSSFSQEALSSIGTSNGKPVSVAAIGFITIGHIYHHIQIVNERYR